MSRTQILVISIYHLRKERSKLASAQNHRQPKEAIDGIKNMIDFWESVIGLCS